MGTPGLIRRLSLSGDYTDPDWTDPASPIPDNVRPFAATGDKVIFDVIAKASTDSDAVEVDVGTLEVNAWVGYEGGPRDPSNPAAGKTIRRGISIVEASITAAPLSARIRLVATDVRGSRCYLNLALTGVGALTAVDVILVEGGRPV